VKQQVPKEEEKLNINEENREEENDKRRIEN